MRERIFTVLFFSCISVAIGVKAGEISFLNAKNSVPAEVKQSFQKEGRMLFYVSTQNKMKPRNFSEMTMGSTPENREPDQPFIQATRNKVFLTGELENLSAQVVEKYSHQVDCGQNICDGLNNVPEKQINEAGSAGLTSGVVRKLTPNKMIAELEITNSKFIKTVVIKSALLSKFSGYSRYLKASILLPTSYFDDPHKTYPICYRIPGLNGRYDEVNKLLRDKAFMKKRSSDNAPQVIYVFLDSEGPYGDTYQIDSENNGPCGKALTEELIPEIEKQVRYNPASKMRFLTGYSTGGWVALALQIFYPDFFDGTWSYSPDPVTFERYGLINIYEDESVFYNKYGYLQPGRRTIYGDPTLSMKDWIANENSNSKKNDYRFSGGQFGSYNAVFGPKGKGGLPSLMFDPITGKIDHAVAKQWEKYDLKKVLEKNWSKLGPKLQGKIWIWTGDMDGLYSNVATRVLKMYLDKTENPRSDAIIKFTPMAGHCQEWNDEAVLRMIADKVSIKK